MQKNGFTLTELILVIFLITLFSTIIVAKSDVVKRYQLKKYASLIANDISYTQKLAITENSDYVIKFLPSSNLYLIKPLYNITKTIKLVNLPDNISIESYSKLDIVYTKKGTLGKLYSSSGTAGTIYLKCDIYAIKITVSVATGKVKVYDIYIKK